MVSYAPLLLLFSVVAIPLGLGCAGPQHLASGYSLYEPLTVSASDPSFVAVSGCVALLSAGLLLDCFVYTVFFSTAGSTRCSPFDFAQVPTLAAGSCLLLLRAMACTLM